MSEAELYTDDRGNVLTEDEYIAWCEAEEERRATRYASYEPVMEGE